MNDNKDWLGNILFMFLGGILVFLLMNKEVNNAKRIDKIETDTVYKNILTLDTVYLKAKPKIYNDTTIITMNDTLILRDTIIQTKPFLAQLDTITDKYALYLDYAFPKNEFRYNLVIKDSVKYIEVTNIKFTNNVYWYQKPEYIVPLTVLTTVGLSTLLRGSK